MAPRQTLLVSLLFALLWLVPAFAQPAKDLGPIRGGSVGNGGNGSEGQMQWVATQLFLPSLSIAENRKILTDTELSALTQLIEDGIPFSPVDPASLEKGRYSDSRGKPALTQQSSTNGVNVTRLLDNQGQQVDARVVWDLTDEKYLVQWDEAAWVKVSSRGQAYPEALVRDIAHEILRFAFHTGAITRNDDQRKISNRLKLRGGAPVRHLPSDSYRLDLNRRAPELVALMERIAAILRTDMKDHSETAERLPSLMSTIKRMKAFDRALWPNSDEDLAENFDDVHRNLLNQLDQLELQKRIALIRKPPATAPSSPRDFDRRAEWLRFRIQRLFDLLHWNAVVRDSEQGKRIAGEVAMAWRIVAQPFDRRNVNLSDADLVKWFDSWDQSMDRIFDVFRKQLGY